MMHIKRWIPELRYRIRAFLGIDVLPTRAETIALRDDLAKYHREVMLALQKPLRSITPLIQNYNAPNLDWDAVQRIELAQMIANPPKED